MTGEGYRYVFGRPVLPREPSASSQRRLFILGAYPSALHVRWRPPRGHAGRGISAIPVDNEPEPFWNGGGADELVAKWLDEIKFDDAWGRIDVSPNINGPSGAWLDSKLLKKFNNAKRSDAWITDCLDTYRLSSGARKALDDTYDCARARYGWPAWNLREHASEDEVARESLSWHTDRLRGELRACQPELVVSLGNAALRVLGKLLSAGPDRIEVAGYGTRLNVGLGGRAIEWLPLAHPAAPQRYQEAHQGWIGRRAAP